MQKHASTEQESFNCLTVARLGKKFPAFNGNRRFMILFKPAGLWSYKTPDDLARNQKAYRYAIHEP
jgi:hypothetical protein